MSFCIALSDLIKINTILHENNDSDHKCSKHKDSKQIGYNFLYFKISIGFLHETYNLLSSAFKDNDVKSHFLKDNETEKEWMKIQELISKKVNFPDNQNKLYFNLIAESHNIVIFHYPDSENDFKKYKKVIAAMQKDKIFTSFKPRQKLYENDYVFADEIQLNMVVDLYKTINIDQVGEIYKNLAEAMGSVTSLLNQITVEYLNRLWDDKAYTVIT